MLVKVCINVQRRSNPLQQVGNNLPQHNDICRLGRCLAIGYRCTPCLVRNGDRGSTGSPKLPIDSKNLVNICYQLLCYVALQNQWYQHKTNLSYYKYRLQLLSRMAVQLLMNLRNLNGWQCCGCFIETESQRHR